MNDQVWQSVLGEIELSVSKASYATWFKNTVLVESGSDKVVVGVPNIFAKQQLEVKFNELVVKALQNNGVTPKQVEYAIHSSPTTRSPGKTTAVASSQLSMPRLEQEAPSRRLDHPPANGLNDRYTFANFIVGSGNELAYVACQAIVENLGTKYNPLFVYGGVGLGKTHLIQAVGNEVIRRQPEARVVYISSETFVNEFLDAIRYKKKGFSDRYRSVDVLVIDDMQFIAGKEKTQEEFFHTFNALHQSNKQIIISSDKPPKSIPTLTDRLRSRFEWGMTVDIQPPDFETRCAIIQTKASQHEFTIPKETVEYLATHVQTNIRELEGALNQLIAYCQMKSIYPDTEVAVALLSSTRLRPKHVSARSVVERTAKHFQLSVDDLVGPKRDKEIVVPRQIAMYILRSELHLSFPKIAHELGRKDHTTAIHSVDKIEKLLRLDAVIRDHVNNIKERLYV